jgi:protein-L-isoaspartate(D-aspartate) O-methyltransferase
MASSSIHALALHNMIEQQVRPWNVLDERLLAALAHIPRAHFADPAYHAQSYMDIELPLPEAQWMLSPKVEARLIQSLELTPGDAVLEIGTGSGYSAALMAQLCREIVTLEQHAALAQSAQQALKTAGCHHVRVLNRDASAASYQPDQTYDAIVLSGSVSALPERMLDWLKPNGRLVAIVGQEPTMTAYRYNKAGDKKAQFETVAPALNGFGAKAGFTW